MRGGRTGVVWYPDLVEIGAKEAVGVVCEGCKGKKRRVSSRRRQMNSVIMYRRSGV